MAAAYTIETHIKNNESKDISGLKPTIVQNASASHATTQNENK